MTNKLASEIASANQDEVKLIQSTFAGNERLLITIRSLFFGLPMTKTEKESVRSAFKADLLRKIFWKRFRPSLDNRDVGIGQTVDLWAGVDIRGQSRDAIYQSVMARKLLIDYTEKALKLLENPEGEIVDLNYDPELNISDQLHVKLVARNSFLSHIENQLSLIKLIADQKVESVDEAKARIVKNSNK